MIIRHFLLIYRNCRSLFDDYATNGINYRHSGHVQHQSAVNRVSLLRLFPAKWRGSFWLRWLVFTVCRVFLRIACGFLLEIGGKFFNDGTLEVKKMTDNFFFYRLINPMVRKKRDENFCASHPKILRQYE